MLELIGYFVRFVHAIGLLFFRISLLKEKHIMSISYTVQL